MKELVFRGRLRPEANRDEVIAALARKFNRTPQQIEQSLFSGRATRIAAVETRAEAVRRAAEFARMGVMLEIRDASGPAPAAGDTAGQAEPASTRRRLIAIGALGCLLVILIGAAAWYTAPAWVGGDRTDAEVATAHGLASDDILFLGHIDVGRIAMLEERLLGQRDPGALLGDEDDLWTSLQRSGIDLRAQVDDALFAGYIGKDGLETAMVLLGRFDPERLRQWVGERYQVEDYFPSTRTVHFNSELAGDECAPGTHYAARFAENRVLVTSPGRLPELARRMQQPPRPAVDLDRWSRLSTEQIATLGLFAPDRLGEAADGLTGMILAGAGEANSRAETAYLGFAPALMPPGLILQGEIVSSDLGYLQQTHQGARDFLDRGRSRAEKAWPELVPLYDRAEIEREGSTLQASLRLDTNFDDELGTLFTAVIGDLFSVEPGDGKTRRTESIDENPRRYTDIDADRIKPFTHWDDDTSGVAWHEGPFGIRVAGTRVVDDRHVVEVAIEGRGLPNTGKENSGLRMRVEDVLDRSGESLLATPECGVDENRSWVEIDRTSEGSVFRDGELVRYGSTQGSHELTLAEGATAADIAAIEGTLEYALPTRVEQRKLAQPLAGEVVETGNLRVRFQPGGEQSLAYQYSGDTERLLAVRALNEQGQVLRQSSSMRGDLFFGNGRRATVAYNGDVAAAEIVMARELQTQRYAFRLDSGLPTLSASALQPPRLPTISPKGALDRAMEAGAPEVTFEYNQPADTVELGPVLIALNGLQAAPGFGLYGSLEVYAAPDLPVAHDLNGAVVHIDTLVDPDDREIKTVLARSVQLEPDGAYWLNGEYTVPEDNQWLKGATRFQMPDHEGGVPTAIEGRVRLRSVTRSTATGLSARVGNRLRGDAFDVSVTGWSGGNGGSISLRVKGPIERLISATAHDDEGRRVDTGVRLGREGDEAKLTINVNRWPQRIRLEYVTESETRERAFRLRPLGN